MSGLAKSGKSVLIQFNLISSHLFSLLSGFVCTTCSARSCHWLVGGRAYSLPICYSKQPAIQNSSPCTVLESFCLFRVQCVVCVRDLFSLVLCLASFFSLHCCRLELLFSFFIWQLCCCRLSKKDNETGFRRVRCFLIDHHHHYYYYYYLRCTIVLGLKQFSFYKTKPKVLFVIAASERR